MTFDYRTQYQEYRKYVKKLMAEAQTPAAKTSLAIVGTLLLIAFLSLVAIRPTLVIVASLTRSIADEQKVLEALQTKIALLQTAQRKLDVVKDKLAPANSAIPPQPELEKFIKEVEILSWDAELKLLNVEQQGIVLNLGQPISPKVESAIARPVGVERIDLKLSIGGEEAAIRKFLDDLVNLDRLVVVGETTITDVSENVDADKPFPVQAAVSVSVFTTQKISINKPKPDTAGEPASPQKDEL